MSKKLMSKKLKPKYMFTLAIYDKLNALTLLSIASTILLNTILLKTDAAIAQVARISGSSTFVNSGLTTVDNTTGITTTRTGGISTVSAESVLPTGFFYSGNVVVAPSFSTVSDGTTTSVVVESLSVGAGAIGSVNTISPNSTFNSAAAKILVDAAAGNVTNIDAAAAIVKAGAGINGLD